MSSLDVSSVYALALMLFGALHSYTDCQSNALTPSICSMVTYLMDFMSWVAASIKCYVFCGYSTQATVRSSVYTWIITCYNIHAYNIHTLISCINCYCTCVLSNVRTITALWSNDMYLHGYHHWMLWQTCFDTFMCVDYSWTCSHYTTFSTHFDIGTVSSVSMNLCFNEFAEPSTRT